MEGVVVAVAMSLLAALASGKGVAEEAEAADESIVPRITADAIGLIGWMDGCTEVRFGCVLFREGSSSGALMMMRVCSQSILSMQALSPLSMGSETLNVAVISISYSHCDHDEHHEQ